MKTIEGLRAGLLNMFAQTYDKVSPDYTSMLYAKIMNWNKCDHDLFHPMATYKERPIWKHEMPPFSKRQIQAEHNVARNPLIINIYIVY